MDIRMCDIRDPNGSFRLALFPPFFLGLALPGSCVDYHMELDWTGETQL